MSLITGIRGTCTQNTFLYVVSGNKLYRYDQATPDATPAELEIGTLQTAYGDVSMATNGTQVCIVDGVTGYIATDIADMEVITDADFPDGVDTVVATDSVFVVCQDGEREIYQSDILDGLSWNGLAVATKEGAPDPLRTIVVSQRELLLIGYLTSEIWVNNGDSTILFQRSGNAFIEAGAAAKRSVAKLDYTIFWLGQDARGQGIVWRLQGYNPVRVSDHAIEYWINQADSLEDAIGFAYQQEGHSYYVLTIPDLDQTFVYDISSDRWHERAWRDPLSGSLNRWRAQNHVFFDGKNIIGDWEDGKLYELDLDVYLDRATIDGNGDATGDLIRRVRVTQTINDDQKKMFFSRLQIDMQVGVGTYSHNDAVNQAEDPQVMLRYSDENGKNWSDILYHELGKAGESDTQVVFSNLGAGYNRVWELSITDPVKAVVLGANAQLRKGRA